MRAEYTRCVKCGKPKNNMKLMARDRGGNPLPICPECHECDYCETPSKILHMKIIGDPLGDDPIADVVWLCETCKDKPGQRV